MRLLGFTYHPSGSGITGLEGEVEIDQWARCINEREVLIYRTDPAGAVRVATVFTGGGGFGWEPGERPPPGKYFARIRRDIRYQNFRGEKRKLICRRDTSNLFIVAPE